MSASKSDKPKAKRKPRKPGKPRAKRVAGASAPKKRATPVGKVENWKPGHSGNPKGRKPGSKQRLSDAFIEALADDFAVNGVVAIQECRENSPTEYLKLVAKLQPRDVNLNVGGEAFANLWSLVASGGLRSLPSEPSVIEATVIGTGTVN